MSKAPQAGQSFCAMRFAQQRLAVYVTYTANEQTTVKKEPVLMRRTFYSEQLKRRVHAFADAGVLEIATLRCACSSGLRDLYLLGFAH